MYSGALGKRYLSKLPNGNRKNNQTLNSDTPLGGILILCLLKGGVHSCQNLERAATKDVV